MRKKVIIALQFIAVTISIAVGFKVYQSFIPKIFIEDEGELIGQKEICDNPGVFYGGKIVGEDIPGLKGAKDLKELDDSVYVTAIREDPIYTLYVLDEEWEAKHHFKLFLMRFGIAVIMCFVLGGGLFFAVQKLSARLKKGRRKT